jgi:hypothetical protein
VQSGTIEWRVAEFGVYRSLAGSACRGSLKKVFLSAPLLLFYGLCGIIIWKWGLLGIALALAGLLSYGRIHNIFVGHYKASLNSDFKDISKHYHITLNASTGVPEALTPSGCWVAEIEGKVVGITGLGTFVAVLKSY